MLKASKQFLSCFQTASELVGFGAFDGENSLKPHAQLPPEKGSQDDQSDFDGRRNVAEQDSADQNHKRCQVRSATRVFQRHPRNCFGSQILALLNGVDDLVFGAVITCQRKQFQVPPKRF